MPQGKRRVLGVVLCGGHSRRMGHDKSMLKAAGGQCFHQLAADRLAQLCEQVVLSVAHEQTIVSRYKLLTDPRESFGPITGIAQALRYAKANGYAACCFNPVDTPDLSVNELRQLIESHDRAPGHLVCAVNDSDADRLETLISLVPTTCLHHFEEAIADKCYRLQSVFRSVTQLTRVTLPAAACKNINTPEQLAPWMKPHAGH